MLSFTPVNFCLVAVSLLAGTSSGTYYAQTERDGYRQVNTLLSHAFTDIMRDGQYHSICTYNAGFPWPEGTDPDEVCSKKVVDPDSCTRRWDNSEEPAGILAKIISTGKFKWCIHETRLCSTESLPYFANSTDDCVKIGLAGVAENDNELQGIAKGDYYGTPIDKMNALTITMGKTLHVPLRPKFVVIETTDKGQFGDLADALARDKCYATIDEWYRHPYREAVVDFTCPTRREDIQVQALHALPSSGLNLEDVYNSDGEGVSACSPGDGSAVGAMNQLHIPKAEVIEVDWNEWNDLFNAFCRQDCDVLIFGAAPTSDYMVTEFGCPEEPITFKVPPSSSAGGYAGAMTHRV